MKTLFVLLVLTVSAFAQRLPLSQILGPYSAAINYAADLAGTPDAAAWGDAGSIAVTAVFAAPAGYRTRIIHVTGNFIAWPRSGVVATGTSAEVGFGLKTTAQDGSIRISYAGTSNQPYDNSFVWVQGIVAVGDAKSVTAVDFDTRAGGLLGSDNTLLVQSFVALNTTGLTIHMEPTFICTYQFEPI